jgi:hypothetical protein
MRGAPGNLEPWSWQALKDRDLGRFAEANFIVGYFAKNINLLSLLLEFRSVLP